jgi:hypothetical protein
MSTQKEKSKLQAELGSKFRGSYVSILGNKLKLNGMKPSGDISTVMYETNYSKFTLFEQNRDIDERAVNDLVVSIKKKGQLQPLIVNDLYEVIDGQHRLKACEILDIPVSYLISNKATIKDVVLINNTQRSWRNLDYLKTFSHKSHPNHEEYVKIKVFIEAYGLGFGIALDLLAAGSYGKGGRDSWGGNAFKAGTFKIRNLEQANRWAGQLIKIKAFAPQLVRILKFSIGFRKIQKLDGFSLNTCYEQIEKNIRKFDRCVNQEDWDEAMVKAYNYNLRKKQKRISIKKEGF